MILVIYLRQCLIILGLRNYYPFTNIIELAVPFSILSHTNFRYLILNMKIIMCLVHIQGMSDFYLSYVVHQHNHPLLIINLDKTHSDVL